MPNIDLSILNQRQTPAFYADVFANRPAAGFVGRIFVSTDTYAFYRDNGTGWDLIGGPGTGTVTGTGANGQVTFWNGASTITGSNDLFWDSTNGHFGVNTNAPGTALDVHHDQPTVAILNQTVATNDVRIGFQNNGVGLWRIGAFYNAGANDFGIYDAVAAIQPVTVKKTTGQVLIGTSTVGSGKLVVASATGDNGIQIVGATAPSLRIDSAESGPTKRVGLGISTATNNFIQGSADRDFCIFNGSTAAASPILFGIYDAAAVNVQEAARISAARNFLIGTTTDAGQKLQVSGTSLITGAATFNSSITFGASTFVANTARLYTDNLYGAIFTGRTGSACDLLLTDRNGNLAFQVVNNGTTPNVIMNSGGNVGIGNTNPLTKLVVATASNVNFEVRNGADYGLTGVGIDSRDDTRSTRNALFLYGAPVVVGGGNLLIGTTTDDGNKLQVSGTITTTGIGRAANQNTLNLATAGVNYTILNFAFSGMIAIRDNTTGGSAVYLLDPNLGVNLISSNLTFTLTFTYTAGNWVVARAGGVNTNIGFVTYGNN